MEAVLELLQFYWTWMINNQLIIWRLNFQFLCFLFYILLIQKVLERSAGCDLRLFDSLTVDISALLSKMHHRSRVMKNSWYIQKLNNDESLLFKQITPALRNVF